MIMTNRKHNIAVAIASVLTVCLSVSSLHAEENTAETGEHPLIKAIAFAETCLEKVEALPGYEATFFKKEVVGSSMVSHKIGLKIRHKPFSVYLHFENPYEGREVIYVEGQNNGKLIAHEAGLLSIAGAMELAPTDTLAMSENRHPITSIGIAKMLRIMIDRWKGETKYGETDVKYFPQAKLGSMTCRVVESSHPRPRRQFTYHKVRLWVDTASGFPVRMQTFGFPKTAGAEPPVLEDYIFMNLKTDVQLTDADFDRNNEKYNF